MTTLLIIIFIFILALVIWALFGKGEEQEKVREEKVEEKTLRRRSTDKMIEEQFPDSDGRGYRRKEDIEAIEEMSKVEDDFQLPYSANDIIPDGSKYWVYNRTLVNSEIYARKGDLPTAISLYRGVYERVIDQNVNSKIRANVDYLQEYQKNHAQKKSEALKQKAGEKKGGEIRLSLDGPFDLAEKIQIALTPPSHDPASKFDINKIVDDIVEKVAAKSLSVPKKEEELGSEIRQLKEKTEEISKIRDGIQKLNDRLLDVHHETGEMSKLKDGILKLNNRLLDVYQETEETKKGMLEMRSKLAPEIEQTKFEPKTTEVKYQATFEAPPVAGIKSKIPVEEVPEPKKVEFQSFIEKTVEKSTVKEAPAKQDLPELKKAEPESTFEEPPIDKSPGEKAAEPDRTGPVREIQKEIKEEEPEEIEVLSQFEKEEEYSGLTDEDIFEKILREDAQKKKDDSFEIVGYGKDEADAAPYLMGKEMENREKDEEQFYRKFLRHGRRVRKELPILKVSFDFSKLPDEFGLSKDQNILQHSFYKYKPMLEKANEFIKRRNVRDAINYYSVVKEQNIPPEFKLMLDKNINELTEYIEKYLTAD